MPTAPFIDRMFHRKVLRRWRAAAEEASNARIEQLPKLRSRAKEVRRMVEEVIHRADARLLAHADGAQPLAKPLFADWAHRPAIWAGPVSPSGVVVDGPQVVFGNALRVFHDGNLAEISLRQQRNTKTSDRSPFGLVIDIFGLDASYISLSLDMPPEGVVGLDSRYIVMLALSYECERPMTVYARLNVQHGPNVVRVVRDVPPEAQNVTLEFDLGFTGINPKRISKMWIDFIFEGAEMNQIHMRDVSVFRRLRAEV
jgi:hypothetical protein